MVNFFEYSKTVKYDANEDTQESGGVAKLQFNVPQQSW